MPSAVDFAGTKAKGFKAAKKNPFQAHWFTRKYWQMVLDISLNHQDINGTLWMYFDIYIAALSLADYRPSLPSNDIVLMKRSLLQ